MRKFISFILMFIVLFSIFKFREKLKDGYSIEVKKEKKWISERIFFPTGHLYSNYHEGQLGSFEFQNQNTRIFFNFDTDGDIFCYMIENENEERFYSCATNLDEEQRLYSRGEDSQGQAYFYEYSYNEDTDAIDVLMVEKPPQSEDSRSLEELWELWELWEELRQIGIRELLLSPANTGNFNRIQ